MSDQDNQPTRSIGVTARGGARSAIVAQTVVQVGSALATVILARILAPAEFGIIALAQSLMGVASLVSLAGITAAIVTHRGDPLAKASTYAWVALIVGGSFAGLLTLAGGPVVGALGQPGTAPFVAVLSLNLPISLLTLVPQALLQRRLQFIRMNAVTVAGAMAYFTFEIVTALLGWGAWAVIWGQVVGSLTSLLVAMALALWLPLRRPRLVHVRDDVSLIANMGVGAFFTYVSKNADYWAVSGTMGAGPLGVYYISYVLPSMVRVRLSGIFRQVMLPLIASLPDMDAQGRTWGLALRASLGLALPAMFGIAAISNPLVMVLFGERWMAAALPMKIITMAGLADILIQAVSTMAIARREMVTRTTILVAIRAAMIGGGAWLAGLLGLGLVGVASAVLAASAITLVIQDRWISRHLGVGIATVGRELFGLLAASAGMYVTVELLLAFTSAFVPAAGLLVIGICWGVAAYGALAWVLARSAFLESWKQLRRLLTGS